jgi:hypothetical protein
MSKQERRARLGPSMVIAFPLALVAALATAGSSSTTLPNGAELSVSIDDPVTSTEFEVPPGQPTIDVDVSGTASIGEGEADATFVYVMDVSGSTDVEGGTGCAPILACEQQFFTALNQAVVADGSADEVGLVVYADTGATADMSPAGGDQIIVAPDAPGMAPFHVETVVDSTFSDALGGNGGVGQFTLKNVGQFTNCRAGLEQSLLVVNASTNGTNVVIFASDGLCNTGGSIAAAVAALQASGAVVHSVAIGENSSCTSDPEGFGSLEDMNVNGGQCFEVGDPGNLPDIIPSLIGSTLESLQIGVDGGAPQTIPNADISLPLPQPGAVTVSYTTTVAGLGPGDHTLCVTANGSDVTGGTASTTRCETIHLLQLTATPAEATNELGSDNQHTVIATLLGPPSHIGGRTVSFTVAGQNAGATGTCSPNPDCTTDAGGVVSFTYSVPIAPASLGTDTITVATTIAGQVSSIEVTKRWVDTTPPAVACVETVNPHGRTVPPAGQRSPGQNEDGFYELLAVDAVDPNPFVFVTDSGSGTTFGPFPSGTRIKYTQAPGATPSIRPRDGNNGQAVAVNWHIKGTGDALVYAVDISGNQAAAVSCLVPPPPK